ncbi:OmpH family outer membrane protein [Fulvivirga sp. M361]|uniref:OmpH family outer membrane protein n=1 Tax=Fulvivirga sp. M361 TaxID=2594266 RepID=UPI00117B6BC0|nr:OmpH family outer membrane protein [Fulvivirga sp. M361]TRX51860.1 OmpH family outer membrane protein [Fulvivirga sp. M361]
MVTIALAGLLYLQWNDAKLAYVDSAQLLSKYQGMIDARNSFQEKSALWQSNVDTLEAELWSEQQKFEQEEEQMTVKERKLSQKLLLTKRQQLSDYLKAIQEKVKQEDSKMTTQVVEQVNTYLKDYGQKKGYRIIIAATEFGNLAYAEEGLDITEEVLKGLNKIYAGL